MADVKRQTFNPDNVMMNEVKEGEILGNFNEAIMLDVAQGSKIMQLGKYQEMTGKEKEFTFWADKPGAYWVGEGRKIQTSKPSLVTAKMVARKLGVIVVASREYLEYTYRDFFNAMKPQIVEAFQKKFDEAGILNVDNPFENSIEQAVVKAGNVVEGAINYENVMKLDELLNDEDLEVNAYISKSANVSALRQVVDAQNNPVYDNTNKVLDGKPVVTLKSTDMKKGDVYAGDFDKVFYGVPYPIHFKIDESAQLSTIENEDGTAVNLFEQELFALRATMDVAVLIADDNAFSKLEAPAVNPGAPAENLEA